MAHSVDGLINVQKIQEHLFAVLKHWVALMGGIASVAIAAFEQSLRITGIPGWVFLIVSAVCFLVAFHQAWLDKDHQLQASLGSAPEVLLEWQCGKKNPLTLRNLRGSTAYHVKINDIVIKGGRYREARCTAKFEEVPHIAEGASIGVLPQITDMFVNPQKDSEWKEIKDDFVHVLEAAYQTYGHDFHPVNVPLFVCYEDKNGRRYGTSCNVSFDRYKITANVTCEPPRRIWV